MPKSAIAHGACSREGPAAKIVTRNQHGRVAVRRLIEDKVSDFVALAVKPHFIKQVHAETGPLDRFQKHLWNNHVGVDVDQRHGRRDA